MIQPQANSSIFGPNGLQTMNSGNSNSPFLNPISKGSVLPSVFGNDASKIGPIGEKKIPEQVPSTLDPSKQNVPLISVPSVPSVPSIPSVPSVEPKKV